MRAGIFPTQWHVRLTHSLSQISGISLKVGPLVSPLGSCSKDEWLRLRTKWAPIMQMLKELDQWHLACHSSLQINSLKSLVLGLSAQVVHVVNIELTEIYVPCLPWTFQTRSPYSRAYIYPLWEEIQCKYIYSRMWIIYNDWILLEGLSNNSILWSHQLYYSAPSWFNASQSPPFKVHTSSKFPSSLVYYYHLSFYSSHLFVSIIYLGA